MSAPMNLTQVLFQLLTREEWKCCWAVAFLADSEDYGDHIDLERFATPGGRPEDAETWLETFRRCVRWLADLGFRFEALDPKPDGRIDVLSDGPIEPANILFYAKLATGDAPDYVSALETALEVLPERCPGADLEVFRAALADLQNAVRRVPAPDREIEQKGDDFADIALSTVGVVRGNGRIH